MTDTAHVIFTEGKMSNSRFIGGAYIQAAPGPQPLDAGEVPLMPCQFFPKGNLSFFFFRYEHLPNVLFITSLFHRISFRAIIAFRNAMNKMNIFLKIL